MSALTLTLAECLEAFSNMSLHHQKKFLKEARNVTKKNQENRPRRLPSPYMLFSSEHRSEAQKWCLKNCDKTDSGKTPPGVVMKRLGIMWQEAKESGADKKYIQMRKDLEANQESTESTTVKPPTIPIAEDSTSPVESVSETKNTTKKQSTKKKKPTKKKKKVTIKEPEPEPSDESTTETTTKKKAPAKTKKVTKKKVTKKKVTKKKPTTKKVTKKVTKKKSEPTPELKTHSGTMFDDGDDSDSSSDSDF